MIENKPELLFLKLGGSLITKKQQAAEARLDVIQRLAKEIAGARKSNPRLSILLGHGSGSFGHVPAKKYATRDGITNKAGWMGFLEVWRAALALNRIVSDTMIAQDVPVLTFPPSASLVSSDHQVFHWSVEPIRMAIEAGLVPLVYGDVVFDRIRQGTIYSTEDLFEHLTAELHPSRILLAGLEMGVWADYPRNQTLLTEITPKMMPTVLPKLRGSSAIDVTGGMLSKVMQCIEIVTAFPELEIWIFSGSQPGSVEKALLGETIGTVIHSDI